MKKILTVLILATVLTSLVVPAMASAEGPNECCELKKAFKVGSTSYIEGNWIGPTTENCDRPADSTYVATADWGLICLLNTIYGITNLIFILLMAVSVIMILAGGFTILTAGGNAEQVGTGKNYITYAVVGIAVALLARVIPSIVVYIL